MDLLQFPKTFKGNKYCLVLIDHFSKWVAVVPIADKSSLTVSRKLEHQVLPFLPKVPNRILTDNGTEFTSQVFQQVLQKHNIKHVRISPLHPSSCLLYTSDAADERSS